MALTARILRTTLTVHFRLPVDRADVLASSAIDWQSECTVSVVRKIRAGEGHPGVLDAIEGTEFHLFGVTTSGRCAAARRR